MKLKVLTLFLKWNILDSVTTIINQITKEEIKKFMIPRFRNYFNHKYPDKPDAHIARQIKIAPSRFCDFMNLEKDTVLTAVNLISAFYNMKQQDPNLSMEHFLLPNYIPEKE